MQIDQITSAVECLGLEPPILPNKVVARVKELLANELPAMPEEIGNFTAYFDKKKPRVLLLSEEELPFSGSQKTHFFRAYSCTAKKVKEVVAMSLPSTEHGKRRYELMQKLAVKDLFPKNYGFYATQFEQLVFQEKATCDLLDLYDREQGLFRLDFKKKKAHFRSLLMAASLLRQNDVIHRDIKLENVLVCKDGVLKLSDLGFAHQLNDAEAAQVVSGTLQILAPEILGWLHLKQPKPRIGFEADIWALGLVLYSFTSREMPNHQWELYKLGDTLQELYKIKLLPLAEQTIQKEQLEARKKEQLATWQQEIEHLPPRPERITRLHDIVISMLQIAPEARMTPDEALAALEHCKE